MRRGSNDGHVHGGKHWRARRPAADALTGKARGGRAKVKSFTRALPFGKRSTLSTPADRRHRANPRDRPNRQPATTGTGDQQTTAGQKGPSASTHTDKSSTDERASERRKAHTTRTSRSTAPRKHPDGSAHSGPRANTSPRTHAGTAIWAHSHSRDLNSASSTRGHGLAHTLSLFGNTSTLYLNGHDEHAVHTSHSPRAALRQERPASGQKRARRSCARVRAQLAPCVPSDHTSYLSSSTNAACVSLYGDSMLLCLLPKYICTGINRS